MDMFRSNLNGRNNESMNNTAYRGIETYPLVHVQTYAMANVCYAGLRSGRDGVLAVVLWQKTTAPLFILQMPVGLSASSLLLLIHLLYTTILLMSPS